MADTSPIGIFDSGVGGLTILLELKKLLPKESFIYVADQKYAPYGKKTTQQVKERALKIAAFLKGKNCKLIVVACNTATIAAVEALRKKLSIPIIGVVPVIKTAAEISKKKHITVFATPSTIKSRYLERLINKFARGTTVYKNGATGLESIIERGEIGSLKITQILQYTLSEKNLQGSDVIVLGCTHYPFLREKIKKIVGRNIKVIDSGGAVARHTKLVLQNEKLLSSEKTQDLYYTTKDKSAFEMAVRKLTGKKITAENIKL